MSDGPPGRRRQRNPRGSGAQLRAEIVAAAGAMIIEEGYESVITLRGVARRIGITATAIYAHFSTPEEIVQAVVFETFGRLNAYIRDAIAGVETPRERPLRSCRAYTDFGMENPALYGLLFNRSRHLHGRDPRAGAPAQQPGRLPLAGPGAPRDRPDPHGGTDPAVRRPARRAHGPDRGSIPGRSCERASSA